jgi:hypothetical protein
MMWRPLKALAGPFYPLAYLSLAQGVALILLHRSFTRLRWRSLLAGWACNVRPLFMYFAFPVASWYLAASLGAMSSL